MVVGAYFLRSVAAFGTGAVYAFFAATCAVAVSFVDYAVKE